MGAPTNTYNSILELGLGQVPPGIEDPEVYTDLLDVHNAIEAIVTDGLNAGIFIGNSRVITKLEDFDVFDDTTVTFTAGIEYCIRGDVDVSPRRLIAEGNVQLCGSGINRSILRSNVDGGALLTTPGSFYGKDLTITADGTAEVLDCSGTALILLHNVFFHGGSPGQFNNTTGSVIIADFVEFEVDVAPLRIGGDYIRIELNKVFPDSVRLLVGEDFIDFQSNLVVSETIRIVDTIIDIAAGSVGYNFQSLSGLENEGVQIHNNTFRGLGFPVVGLLPSALEAFFSGNIGLINSFPNASWNIIDNTLATVIDFTDTPVIIATDNITLTAFTQRFTLNGVTLTYNGAAPRAFTISSVFVLSTTSNNQRIGAQVFLNGNPTAIIFTATTSGTAGTRVENLTLIGPLALVPGDTIEVRLFNLTSTGNITAEDAIFQIAALGT